jgi:DHA1 family multidrug resistance protein-like MFS transporter
MGGFITQSFLGWRWTAWIILIIGAAFCAAGIIIVPETYGPVILKQRAQRLRHETKNWALHAKIEESHVSFNDIIQKYISRPAQMLVQEPILLLVTIYVSHPYPIHVCWKVHTPSHLLKVVPGGCHAAKGVAETPAARHPSQFSRNKLIEQMALLYGIFYLFFEAFPISFQEERGWNDGVGALPFLGIFVGVLAGTGVVVYFTKTRYARLHGITGRVPPEERLILMAVGACVLPAGMFWFGWTSSPHITWVPQVLAGAPIGFGIFLIFLQGLTCESSFS